MPVSPGQDIHVTQIYRITSSENTLAVLIIIMGSALLHRILPVFITRSIFC